ncbi:hypothetical protein B0H19DRAFT_1238336 [Mycena capillaripes]|nr:hypothetical protein B0H19DRAFT_1238336 [Mycena capillaripes]
MFLLIPCSQSSSAASDARSTLCWLCFPSMYKFSPMSASIDSTTPISNFHYRVPEPCLKHDAKFEVRGQLPMQPYAGNETSQTRRAQDAHCSHRDFGKQVSRRFESRQHILSVNESEHPYNPNPTVMDGNSRTTIHHHSNVGAVAGGVVGGIMAAFLIGLG